MTFDHFWTAAVDKSRFFPEEELAEMTAAKVVRKKKIIHEEQAFSKLRQDALRQIIFVRDVNAVKDKTFQELAEDYRNYYPCGKPKGMGIWVDDQASPLQ